MDFERLVSMHKNAVYKHMVRFCGDQDNAEDALAEALLSAFRASDRLREEEAFRSWLMQIARRACGRLRARQGAHRLVALEKLVEQGREPSVPAPDVLDELQASQMHDCVQTALAGVPDTLREVYLLRDVEGLSGAETAARLGIRIQAMKSRLHRARRVVRERLDLALCAPPS